MSHLEQEALALVRDRWKIITEQWDALRREQPALDDLIAVVNMDQRACAIMPRRQFNQQFNPPSGFEHLKRPAGDVDPPKPRESVMWVLALAREDYASFRVSRHQRVAIVGGSWEEGV